MFRLNRLIPVTVLALGSLLAFSAAAQSQPGPGPGAPPSPSATISAEDTPDNVPVLAVTSVEVVRTAHEPTMDIVVARGVTSTNGWDGATLLPLTHGTPSDGVLDLVLTADPPKGFGASAGEMPIHAVFPLSAEHPYKAIRVRSATNVILLKAVPGYAEMKLIPWACGPCVGKLYVAKGAAAPAGAEAGAVVHAEDLPVNTRIIQPNDGVGDVRPNPNRLTIVIGEDGRIVDAGWQ